MAKKTVVCPVCNHPVQVKTLSILMLLILLSIGIFPGIVYFIWRVCGAKKCPSCGNRI